MTTTDASVEQLVQEMATDVATMPRKHSHSPDSPMTYMLNVTRRHGTPHTPKHCACVMCSRGRADQHLPAVSR